MISSKSGTDISDCSITSINDLGIYVLIENNEYFIPFTDYPGFKNASLNQVFKVRFYPPTQLHWEDIDVDIELQALMKPESFPLIYKP
jgi:hypothetical protein